MESAKRLLIADDDPDIIDLLESYFKRAGYDVTAKVNGKDALQAAEAEKFDLVLLDVMMPKKTGFEVCQALRASDDLQAIKILMLTAKGRDTDVAKGLALGADAYITKPFSTRELVLKVAELLRQSA